MVLCIALCNVLIAKQPEACDQADCCHQDSYQYNALSMLHMFSPNKLDTINTKYLEEMLQKQVKNRSSIAGDT